MIQFHPSQSEVARDRTKFRVVDCGRQWGKTTLAVWEMFACAYKGKGRRVGYFATTFTQARDIAWQQLKEISRPAWAKEPNETRLEIFIKTKDGGTSEIVLKGFESVETARGTQFDLLVLDEVSKMRNFKSGWEGALLGTLAYRNGNALFISTPYGFNHFYDLYKLGQESRGPWKSWKFTSFDNPFLNREYLETIQQTVTPDFWAQEYLADFRRFTGLIYKEFDISRHVNDFEFTRAQHGDYYFGLDFAVRGWTASLVGFINSEGKLHIMDAYKKDNLPAQVHGEGIRGMLTNYNDLAGYSGYADPAGFAKNQQKGNMLWSLADEYIEMGFPIMPANNEVTAGINYVRQLFAKDRIVIHPRCVPLIDELLQYQWKEQSAKRAGEQDDPEKVRKINDHLCDCLRYMAFSKPMPAEAIEQPRDKVFPLTFPPPRIEKPSPEEDSYSEIEIPSVFD